ncbi:hypothetical protein PT2222_90379 [Paraburkholderia tropica]
MRPASALLNLHRRKIRRPQILDLNVRRPFIRRAGKQASLRLRKTDALEVVVTRRVLAGVHQFRANLRLRLQRQPGRHRAHHQLRAQPKHAARQHHLHDAFALDQTYGDDAVVDQLVAQRRNNAIAALADELLELRLLPALARGIELIRLVDQLECALEVFRFRRLDQIKRLPKLQRREPCLARRSALHLHTGLALRNGAHEFRAPRRLLCHDRHLRFRRTQNDAPPVVVIAAQAANLGDRRLYLRQFTVVVVDKHAIARQQIHFLHDLANVLRLRLPVDAHAREIVERDRAAPDRVEALDGRRFVVLAANREQTTALLVEQQRFDKSDRPAFDSLGRIQALAFGSDAAPKRVVQIDDNQFHRIALRHDLDDRFHAREQRKREFTRGHFIRHHIDQRFRRIQAAGVELEVPIVDKRSVRTAQQHVVLQMPAANEIQNLVGVEKVAVARFADRVEQQPIDLAHQIAGRRQTRWIDQVAEVIETRLEKRHEQDRHRGDFRRELADLQRDEFADAGQQRARLVVGLQAREEHVDSGLGRVRGLAQNMPQRQVHHHHVVVRGSDRHRLVTLRAHDDVPDVVAGVRAALAENLDAARTQQQNIELARIDGQRRRWQRQIHLFIGDGGIKEIADKLTHFGPLESKRSEPHGGTPVAQNNAPVLAEACAIAQKCNTHASSKRCPCVLGDYSRDKPRSLCADIHKPARPKTSCTL